MVRSILLHKFLTTHNKLYTILGWNVFLYQMFHHQNEIRQVHFLTPKRFQDEKYTNDWLCYRAPRTISFSNVFSKAISFIHNSINNSLIIKEILKHFKGVKSVVSWTTDTPGFPVNGKRRSGGSTHFSDITFQHWILPSFSFTVAPLHLRKNCH